MAGSPQKTDERLTRNFRTGTFVYYLLPQNGFLIQILWTHFHSCRFSDLLSTKHIASANGATTSVPSTGQLSALRELFQASFHAYTATATPHVRKDIAEQLHLKNQRFLLARSTDRTLPTVSFNVLTRQHKYLKSLEAPQRSIDHTAIHAAKQRG